METVSTEKGLIEKCEAMSTHQLEQHIRFCLNTLGKQDDDGIPRRQTTYDALIDILKQKLIREKLLPYSEPKNAKVIAIVKAHKSEEPWAKTVLSPIKLLRPSKKTGTTQKPEVSARILVAVEKGIDGSIGKRIRTSEQSILGKLTQRKLLGVFNKLNNENLTLGEFCFRVRKTSTLRELLRTEQIENRVPNMKTLLPKVEMESFSKKLDEVSFRQKVHSINSVLCRAFDVSPNLSFKDADILALVKAINLVEGQDISNWKELSNGLRKSKATQFLYKKLKIVQKQLTTEEEVQTTANKIISEISDSITSLRELKAEIIDKIETSLTSTSLPPIEKLPWMLLPPSDNATGILVAHFRKLEKKIRWTGKIFDVSRLKRIEQLRPSRRYVGEDGFEGYIAYCFYRTKRVVLECPIYGNATYVLTDDWQTISKLSKWEARHEHSNQVIVIRHNETWFDRLRSNLEIYY